MERFVAGQVLLVPFPFTDLSGSKRRPTLVLANLPGDDLILCQITSQQQPDPLCVPLETQDFKQGGLKQSSYIRPSQLFTADQSLIVGNAGEISSQKLNEVRGKLKTIFNL